MQQGAALPSPLSLPVDDPEFSHSDDQHYHDDLQEYCAELEVPAGIVQEGEYWRFWRSDYRWNHHAEWKDITRDWVPCKPKPTYPINRKQITDLGQDPFEELTAREDALRQHQQMPPAEQATMVEGVSSRKSSKGLTVTYVKGYGSLVKRGPEYFQNLPMTSSKTAAPAAAGAAGNEDGAAGAAGNDDGAAEAGGSGSSTASATAADAGSTDVARADESGSTFQSCSTGGAVAAAACSSRSCSSAASAEDGNSSGCNSADLPHPFHSINQNNPWLLQGPHAPAAAEHMFRQPAAEQHPKLRESYTVPVGVGSSNCSLPCSSDDSSDTSANSSSDSKSGSGCVAPHPYDPYIHSPQLLLEPKEFASVYAVWKQEQYNKLQAKLQESADYVATIEAHLQLDDPENVVLQQLQQEQQRQHAMCEPQRLSDPGAALPGTWCRATGFGPCDDITCTRCAKMQQTLQQATAVVRKEQQRRRLIDIFHPCMIWYRVKVGHQRRMASVFMGRWNRLLLEARMAEELAELRFMLYLTTKKPIFCF